MEAKKEPPRIEITALEASTVLQLAGWYQAGIEAVFDAILENDPAILVAYTQLLLTHPRVLEDRKVLDDITDRVCLMDGRTTGDEHRRLTLANVKEQARRMVAALQELATASEAVVP